MPRLDLKEEELQPIEGTPPDLFAPPPGCAFAARCPKAMVVCNNVQPDMTSITDVHHVSCWLQDPRAN